MFNIRNSYPYGYKNKIKRRPQSAIPKSSSEKATEVKFEFKDTFKKDNFMNELHEMQREKKNKERVKFNVKECLKAYNLTPSQKSFLKKYSTKKKK